MPDVSTSIRHEAAILARRKRARSSDFTLDAPCDWRPETVTNPEDQNPFTPDGAWNFIADRLEDESQIVECVVLRKPAGKKGYEMLIPQQGQRDICVKFALGAGKILGRSFHYSTRSREEA